MEIAKEEKIVLLDTMIVAGVFAYTMDNQPKEKEKENEWRHCIEKIFIKTNIKPKLAVPTPVCFELAQWHIKWKKYIDNQITNNNREIFKYAKYSITAQAMSGAAQYILESNSSKQNNKDNFDKKKNKISFIDALIASYCLTYDYCLITINQKDFLINLFDVEATQIAPISPNDQERKMIYLLSPNVGEWQKIMLKKIL